MLLWILTIKILADACTRACLCVFLVGWGSRFCVSVARGDYLVGGTIMNRDGSLFSIIHTPCIIVIMTPLPVRRRSRAKLRRTTRRIKAHGV